MTSWVTSVLPGRALQSKVRHGQARNSGLKATAVVRLTWILLFLVIFDCFSAQGQGQDGSCSKGNYSLNGTCNTCTNCSASNLIVRTNCSATADTVCSEPQIKSQCAFEGEFYDEERRLCIPCTECALHEVTTGECNLDQDTVACVPLCAEGFQVVFGITCQLICENCPLGKCGAGHGHCLCDPVQCYDESDIFCRFNLCVDPDEENDDTGRRSSSASNLQPWGIGLIAVGVVIGIIAFSACFLLLGYCTSSAPWLQRSNSDAGSEESQSSQNVLVTSNAPNGTASTALGDQSNHIVTPVIGYNGQNQNAHTNHSSLDALRKAYQHQQQHHILHHQIFNSSVIKSSPRNAKTGSGGRRGDGSRGRGNSSRGPDDGNRGTSGLLDRNMASGGRSDGVVGSTGRMDDRQRRAVPNGSAMTVETSGRTGSENRAGTRAEAGAGTRIETIAGTRPVSRTRAEANAGMRTNATAETRTEANAGMRTNATAETRTVPGTGTRTEMSAGPRPEGSAGIGTKTTAGTRTETPGGRSLTSFSSVTRV